MPRSVTSRPVTASRLTYIFGARIFAVLLAAIGAVLAGGGAYLAMLGGSWYYLLCGGAVLGVAWLLWRRDRRAAGLFALALACTWLWALWEVGGAPWLLMPRVLAPTILGLWFLLPARWRGMDAGTRARTAPRAPSAAVRLGIVLAVASTGVLALRGTTGNAQQADAPPEAVVQDAAPQTTLAAPPAAVAADDTRSPAPGDWPQYGRDVGGSNYSESGQITPENVKDLKLEWTFQTGDLPAPGELEVRGMTFEATPIKIGDRLFFCTPHSKVFALDAETGSEIWRWDGPAVSDQVAHLACRGVSYYDLGNPGAAGDVLAGANDTDTPDPVIAADAVCSKRILYGSPDAQLWALDAQTGKPCADFGVAGAVNLLDGIGIEIPGFLFPSSPPAVIDGKIVLGNWVSDNQKVGEPSGVVRAYDARTGALAWAWDMGHPDRIGAPPPGEEYTRGTPNAWSALSSDPEAGLVYVPTGNATPDFWGGERRPFDDKYSSAVVALNASDGRPRWSFQTTHHDLWDYDVPAQPVVVDIDFPDGKKRAVIQATKRGDIFVLDAATGVPLFPVEERAAPQGGAPGEKLSATQPFSAVTLLPPPLTEASMWGATPLDQMWCRIKFREARYDGIFTPPTVDSYAIQWPGGLGIVDWGGLSVDPVRGLMFANTSLVGYYNRLIARDEAPASMRQITPVAQPGPNAYMSSTAYGPQEGTPFVADTNPFLSPLGIPCNQPPWGYMQALDLKTGKEVWKHPLGTARNNGPLGIKSGLDFTVGVPSLGGSIATASGVVFVAGTIDDYIRAFDSATGKELWRATLPTGGQARPSTYVSEASGRQFVVIAAGGNDIIGTAIGDYVVAYSLPEK